MHEWGITKELVDTVCAQAEENRIKKVSKIRVDLGKESDITEDSLHFCFQVISENTRAGEAELEIRSSAGNSVTLVSFAGETEPP
jgi:hydrogenase nickel incorporation protein HypA/HybF